LGRNKKIIKKGFQMVQLCFWISPELKEKLKDYAYKNRKSMKQLIEEFIAGLPE